MTCELRLLRKVSPAVLSVVIDEEGEHENTPPENGGKEKSLRYVGIKIKI